MKWSTFSGGALNRSVKCAFEFGDMGSIPAWVIKTLRFYAAFTQGARHKNSKVETRITTATSLPVFIVLVDLIRFKTRVVNLRTRTGPRKKLIEF